MSAARVAPMKIPSSWYAHTPSSGAATAQGRYTRAAARAAGSTVNTSTNSAPSRATTTAMTRAVPAAQTVVNRTASLTPARRAAPSARPTSASAANANPSSRNAAAETKCISTALAASTASPCLAPWAVNQAKAKISASERIMMSRLTATVRPRRAASSQRSGDQCPPIPRMWRTAMYRPTAAAKYSARTVPPATPRTSQPKPSTNSASRPMLVTFSTSCSARPVPVRPRPMNHPSSA